MKPKPKSKTLPTGKTSFCFEFDNIGSVSMEFPFAPHQDDIQFFIDIWKTTLYELYDKGKKEVTVSCT